MLLVFTLLATLIGLLIGPILFSITRTLVTLNLRSDYVFNVHAPLCANPSLGLFPLHSDQIVMGAASAAALVAILTGLFIALYPSSQTVAIRLSLYCTGTATLASGTIGTVADLGLLRSLSRWKEIPEVTSGGVLAAAIVGVLVLVVWFERQTIALLGNLFEVDTPIRRLGLWFLRVPLPWGLFAFASFLSRWWGGMVAAGCIIVATLIDDLIHYPKLRYETLSHTKMHEGLAAVIVFSILLGAGSIWVFGLPSAGLSAKAVVYENGQLSIVPVSDLTNRIQEDTMPRIKMQWSDEK